MTAPITLEELGGGTKPFTPHPAGTDEQNALLRWAHDHTRQRPDLKATRYGYKVPNPDGGKPITLPRMTTVAKAIEDSGGLGTWKARNATRGFAANPALIGAIVNPAENAQLDYAHRQASRIGGDGVAADLGTAMATALEVWQHDPNNIADLPAPYDADMAAIASALTGAGITLDASLCETVFVNLEHRVAGRPDCIGTGPWTSGLPRIVDLKTGRIDYCLSWAPQLRGYAGSRHMWTPDGLVDLPEFDLVTGIIINAPIGTGTCVLYEIDLVEGLVLLEHALATRKLRSSPKRLLSALNPGALVADLALPGPGTVAAPVLTEPDDRTAWLAGRIATLKGNTAAMTATRMVWPADLPTAPPWTPEQQDAVHAALSVGEATITAPFPEVQDPAAASAQADEIARRAALRPDNAVIYTLPDPADDNTTVSEPTANGARQSARALPAEQSATLRLWLGDGTRAKRGWQPGQTGECSLHAYACTVAATACISGFAAEPYIEADVDTLTRAAWHLTTCIDPQPAWATGALIGALTADEARQLTKYAVAFRDGDDATAAALGMAVSA